MLPEPPAPKSRTRGRPRQVSLERIAEAGIAITLPKLTIKGIADALGVSVVAIYNHVDGIDALRQLVAEEILRRREPSAPRGDGLKEDLLDFSVSLRTFVHNNPGIGWYLTHINSTSTHGLKMIDTTHARYARLYQLSPVQASSLVSLVAEHAIALAELVHTKEGRNRNNPQAIIERSDLVNLPEAVRRIPRYDENHLFRWSMTAVIIGAIELIKDIP